ncbi:MAG: hypothetical protein ACRDP6_05455 [Actinoallomurus sp.]
MAHRRVPLVLLVALMVVGGMPVRVRAALVSDGDGIGNGRHNRNSVNVHSPEYNRGIQHITNTNVGGMNNTQASFCKWRFRHCRISQRQAFVP